MATLIRHRERIEQVSYFKVFDFNDDSGSGYEFPCDEHGKVDTTDLSPCAQQALAECLLGGLRDRGVRRYVNRYMQPGAVACDCGRECELDDAMTNRCECGQFYNGSGQRLAPPRQWGWDTGESFDDDGNQIL